MSSGHRVSERRTIIDIQMAVGMTEPHGVWRWTDTCEQLARGQTTLQVRQNYDAQFRRGVHAVKYDPELRVLEEHDWELDESAEGDSFVCLGGA